MKYDLTNYYQIFSNLPNNNYDNCVNYLEHELSKLFLNDYNEKFSDTQVVKFKLGNYTFQFDTAGFSDKNGNNYRDERVVAVCGNADYSSKKRDTGRMKGFIGKFTKIDLYKNYDKGHFVAHKIKGGLDHNLYPQLTSLNRGWSKQGKLFRSMERYCDQNPDVFMFSRPIYPDLSWIPEFIDYGIFTKEFGLLLNRFDNKPVKDETLSI